LISVFPLAVRLKNPFTYRLFAMLFLFSVMPLGMMVQQAVAR